MSESVGFISTGGQITGWASDIYVTSSGVIIPALGYGLLNPSLNQGTVSSINPLYVQIEKPLPSSCGDLIVRITDVNNSNYQQAKILSGNTYGYSGGSSFSVSSGDQIVINLSVSGDSLVLPKIQWSTYGM